ncbi:MULTISPECIES: hypothetical protein [Pseudomonas fluorescens group]|uniref:Uncharacterized protein n=1 Tax=Pseudomonas proteolytica TaxID=219574 RepID=A0AAW5A6K0_9PSED|nr:MULTISPECIES: hypothetical protein [Pseudomonas fluorescens group]KAA8702451.1 hypothetical protein F4W61_11580 [Pseudomonas proteolytica]MCF5057492.1 hypothetical protein [Pseudomonas proteolytica]MCF5101881.1 hypothetical protein [Pseudomonas proteolytica]NNA93104.1 hypothetical protein [Pseudomonas gessardii]TWR76250.1 hypothetical protein FIV38_24025 [Pseudomonas proteolytica]
MSSEKIREQFESWVVEEAKRRDYKFMDNVLKRDPSGEYSTTWVDMAWMGWEASRDALFIALPEKDWAPDYGEVIFYEEAVSAIEAAGVKVKT